MNTKKLFEAIEPFAAIYAGARTLLDSLTDDELIEFVEAAHKVSSTNCWCYTFIAANHLVREAEDLIRQRKISMPAKDSP